MIKSLKMKNRKKGFTLIELIIVIAIIGVLAAIALPRFGEVKKNANKSADVANAKTIQSTVVTLIAEDTIKLPTSSNISFTLDGTAETGTDPSNYEDKTKKALQGSLPKAKLSKFSGSYFNVTIDSTGTVTVSVTKDQSSAQVYPQPTDGTDYAE